MNNDALLRFFSPETIDKLEKAAQDTTYQWKYGFERQLNLFRLMAFILATVEEQASQLPMEEAGFFILELDKAGQQIQQELAAFVNDPCQPIKPQLPQIADRAVEYFDGILSLLSDEYLERSAKILARGKGRLLSRMIARLQEQHQTGQPAIE